MNIADLPRPGPDRCDNCDEPFRLDDERIPHDHWRVGPVTLCERCAEGLAAIASIETRQRRAA